MELGTLLKDLSGMGRVMLQVRNAASIAEVFVDLDTDTELWIMQGGMINVLKEHGHLHTRIDGIRRVQFIEEHNAMTNKPSYSVAFLSDAGETVLRIVLFQSADASRDQARINAFQAAREKYGTESDISSL